jgi:hypothetical protein
MTTGDNVVPIKVEVVIETKDLERQIAVIRLLCAQIGYELDNALVSLREIREGK